MKTYRAIRDKIIVEVLSDNNETQLSSGLYIPKLDIDAQFKMEAKIISIGKSCFVDGEPENLEVGAIICIARGCGILLEEYDSGLCLKAILDTDIVAEVTETT